MDWLLVGDLRGMVRERWRQYGVDPDMPLPALAHRDTRVEALGDQLNKSNRQLAELREQLAALRNELAELRGRAAAEAEARQGPGPRPPLKALVGMGSPRRCREAPSEDGVGSGGRREGYSPIHLSSGIMRDRWEAHCCRLPKACSYMPAGGSGHRQGPLVEVVGALNELTERLAKMESAAAERTPLRAVS